MAPAGGNLPGCCARMTVNTHTAGPTTVGLTRWGSHAVEKQNSLPNCKWSVEEKNSWTGAKLWHCQSINSMGKMGKLIRKLNSTMIHCYCECVLVLLLV